MTIFSLLQGMMGQKFQVVTSGQGQVSYIGEAQLNKIWENSCGKTVGFRLVDNYGREYNFKSVHAAIPSKGEGSLQFLNNGKIRRIHMKKGEKHASS